MTCPNCDVKLECPCSNCQGYREKRGEIATLLWEWYDSETMMCPLCGFKAHADYWQDYEINKVLKEAGVDSLTELDKKQREEAGII